MEKIYISWDEIENAVESLAHQIRTSSFKPSYIKGIQRGGLIPAVLLSHKLNIPLITNGILDNSVLVIDDICDSGKTIFETQKYKCFTATIHHKQSAITKPDFYYSLVPEDKWIVYPWENRDSKTIPDYAAERK
jgi:hypoxanthine phosphoribosyltransferase